MFFIFIITLLVLLAVYYWEMYSKFRKHGIKHFTPLPLVGNIAETVLQKKHVIEQFDELYYTFPEDRFVGRFELTRPIILIRDLELLKKITIKDFEYFTDHRTMVDDTMDPLFGRSLFNLKGEEWKDMRSTLSPAFTSSKMRLMVPFMMEVSDMMIQSLKRQIAASGDDYIDVECKNLTSRYANDVIASCAFGLKVDSHTDVDNEFFAMGQDSATFGFRRVLVFLGYASFPQLMKKLKVKLFSDATTDFFKNIILNTMENREKNNIIRPDMIHLLMEAKKGKLSFDEKPSDVNTGFATVEESSIGQKTVNRDWTDEDLVAQTFLFFVAGFETVSTTMSFLLYELAVNPDIQERLAKEIKEHDAKHGGKFDFNSIQNMTYLDMVVSEVLRRWPPAVGLDRLCIKDYNMGKPNKNSKEDFILRNGDALTVPTWTFHHNPEYFEDPYKFDPERFSNENKHKIKPFTYIPFGIGPRNCIGSRFALCEVKVMIYQLLQQMEVSPCEKTRIPAVLAKNTFNIMIEGGHWVRFRTRK